MIKSDKLVYAYSPNPVRLRQRIKGLRPAVNANRQIRIMLLLGMEWGCSWSREDTASLVIHYFVS